MGRGPVGSGGGWLAGLGGRWTWRELGRGPRGRGQRAGERAAPLLAPELGHGGDGGRRRRRRGDGEARRRQGGWGTDGSGRRDAGSGRGRSLEGLWRR